MEPEDGSTLQSPLTETPVRSGGEGPAIHTWVVPGSSRSGIAGTHGGKLKLKVAAPPEGGRATREAATLLEEALGRSVILVKGMTSRHKVFEVVGADVGEIRRKLGLAG